jgi:hypothetical protein
MILAPYRENSFESSLLERLRRYRGVRDQSGRLRWTQDGNGLELDPTEEMVDIRGDIEELCRQYLAASPAQREEIRDLVARSRALFIAVGCWSPREDNHDDWVRLQQARLSIIQREFRCWNGLSLRSIKSCGRPCYEGDCVREDLERRGIDQEAFFKEIDRLRG